VRREIPDTHPEHEAFREKGSVWVRVSDFGGPICCSRFAIFIRLPAVSGLWSLRMSQTRTLLKLSVVFLLLLTVASPRTNADVGAHQNQAHPQAATKPAPDTGWSRRPAEAGDYQTAIYFPDIERPPGILSYWPMDRNLPGPCDALTRAYSEAMVQAEDQLAGLEKQNLSAMGPEILKLPRLYERVGNLAAYNGDMETAIKNLEAAYLRLTESIDFYPNGQKAKLFLEEEIGVAYMKLGEQQNCRLNHNAQMCIVPLSVQGQHKLTTGSEKAIEYFTKYLEVEPKNLEVRWLLNIACMTVGKYPAGVQRRILSRHPFSSLKRTSGDLRTLPARPELTMSATRVAW
jgi:hypothetical protein